MDAVDDPSPVIRSVEKETHDKQAEAEAQGGRGVVPSVSSPADHHDRRREFDTLVLSGGAVDALAFLGCVRHLEENGDLKSMDTFVGTSAGALLAFMLALGYSFEEMRAWALLRLHQCGAHQLDIDDLFGAYDAMGIDSGSRMESFLRDILYAKLGVLDVTFAQLRDATLYMTQGKAAKSLVVCAANVTRSRPEYFCVETWPNLSVITALRASACVPYLFSPVFIGDEMYVDGGIFENLPLGACAAIGRCMARVMALNLTWDIPAQLPRDIVQYSWYLVSSLVHRTNSKNDKDLSREAFVVDVMLDEEEDDRHTESAGGKGAATTRGGADEAGVRRARFREQQRQPFMGFCVDSMEFVLDDDIVERNVAVGYSAMKKRRIII